MMLRMRLHHRALCRRDGFSLIEILVVILIISILASITVAGAFAIISQQRSSNTQLLISKLDGTLQAQWQRVADQAKQEPIPDAYLNMQYNVASQLTSWGILDMAGGDIRRARVIWVKLRLRHAFPQNFQEVLTPNSPQVCKYDPTSRQLVPYLPQPGVNAAVTSPSLTYLRALQGAPVVPGPAGPSENAAMLLLAATQGRNGIAVTADDLGTGALGDGVFARPFAPPGQFLTLKQVVDSWSRPLVFWRWPVANPEITESNPSLGGTTASKFRDPLDPEGTLVIASWNNWTNYRNYQGVWAFEMLFHSVHFTASGPNVPFYDGSSSPRAYYSQPVIVSAGRNGLLGVAAPPYKHPPDPSSPTPTPPVLPPDLRSDPMLSDLSGADNDNILSTRLRLGARGD